MELSRSCDGIRTAGHLIAALGRAERPAVDGGDVRRAPWGPVGDVEYLYSPDRAGRFDLLFGRLRFWKFDDAFHGFLESNLGSIGELIFSSRLISVEGQFSHWLRGGSAKHSFSGRNAWRI